MPRVNPVLRAPEEDLRKNRKQAEQQKKKRRQGKKGLHSETSAAMLGFQVE